MGVVELKCEVCKGEQRGSLDERDDGKRKKGLPALKGTDKIVAARGRAQVPPFSLTVPEALTLCRKQRLLSVGNRMSEPSTSASTTAPLCTRPVALEQQSLA